MSQILTTDLRGTAYGFFKLLSGMAMLIASSLANGLWQFFGASFNFMAGLALQSSHSAC